MVLPLLVIVLVGTLEIGAAFRDFLTTSHAVREGVRLLSAKGDDPEADCSALLAAVETLTVSGDLDDLERIEIYQADADGGQIALKTNTYSFSFGDPEDCDDWDGYPGANYPPISRQVLAGGATPLDIVGMRIVYTHSWLSQIPPFSGVISIDETTISRLEPEGFEP